MRIEGMDHLVLTVASVDKTVDFYTNVLGMDRVIFDDGWTALHFGSQKINLHPKGAEAELTAGTVATGTADFCLLTRDPIEAWVSHLAVHKVEIILGPIQQTGARGIMDSIYFRDPDQNLVEIARYR